MNDIKPIIIWEKWRDPYGTDDNAEIKNIIDDLIHRQSQDLENEDEDEKEQNTVQSSIQEHIGFLKHKMPMMVTPIGLIPFTENTAPGKIFNFWTGHSNFNITNKISNIIEATNGVETLDIFTRYRFRIGVGKAFKDADVMHDINQQVYSHLE